MGFEEMQRLHGGLARLVRARLAEQAVWTHPRLDKEEPCQQGSIDAERREGEFVQSLARTNSLG